MFPYIFMMNNDVFSQAASAHCSSDALVPLKSYESFAFYIVSLNHMLKEGCGSIRKTTAKISRLDWRNFSPWIFMY